MRGKKEKLIKAVFLVDHVFFLNGRKRCVCAEQMKRKNVVYKLPQHMFDDFKKKGIVKGVKKAK
jgi:hypothetical protein